MERRVLHPERQQDVLPHEFAQRLAREFLDEVSLDIHRDAVDPLRAGLVEQRNLGQPVDHALQILRAEHRRVAVHLVDRSFAEDAVGEAGRVAHQLRHRRRVRRIFDDGLAVGVHALVDFEIRELRDVFRDRIARPPLALLIQHHHRDAGDRLGHRVDAEDRVLLHGRAAGHVALAIGPRIDDLAVARHYRDDSRHLAVVDVFLQHRMHTIQSLRGEAYRFRFRLRKVTRLRRPLRAASSAAIESRESKRVVISIPRRQSSRISEPKWPASRYTVSTWRTLPSSSGSAPVRGPTP